MLPEQTRIEIEPDVRAALKPLFELRDAIREGSDTETMNRLGYQVEYALGRMLPTIRGTLYIKLEETETG
jgi:hypothetical protein